MKYKNDMEYYKNAIKYCKNSINTIKNMVVGCPDSPAADLGARARCR